MSNPIRARVKGGVIEPLEQIDLPEGQEVMVTILPPTDREAFQRSAGQWKGTLDAEALIRDIYADRLVSTRPVPSL
jgi:predicted DNA-binding antitoxin AbrB/MazE fold protein